jgi:tRNA pseudouridine55 synthase
VISVEGVCLINKPKGFTSFDVVNKLRRILGERRIGHTGTLDPQAEGVLVVLLGRATKAMPFLVTQQKEYVAELKLGLKTDTGDIWGAVLETAEFIQPTFDSLRSVLASMAGVSQQLPPMVSAIRVEGKRLYEYARMNQTVERKTRKIEIFEIELLEYSDTIKFRVICSSGTYIRTLCEDIAVKLGTIGTMNSLTRTKVQNYKLEDCQNLDEITAENVRLHDLLSVLAHMPQVAIDDPTFVYHGKHLHFNQHEEQVLVTFEGQALAVYGKTETGDYRSVRGLW